MQNYIVELYQNTEKVYEKLVSAKSKENAISNVMRNKAFDINFNCVKVFKVKVSWTKIEE